VYSGDRPRWRGIVRRHRPDETSSVMAIPRSAYGFCHGCLVQARHEGAQGGSLLSRIYVSMTSALSRYPDLKRNGQHVREHQRLGPDWSRNQSVAGVLFAMAVVLAGGAFRRSLDLPNAMYSLRRSGADVHTRRHRVVTKRGWGAYYYLSSIKVMYFERRLVRLDPIACRMRTVAAVRALVQHLVLSSIRGPLVSVATACPAKSNVLGTVIASAREQFQKLTRKRTGLLLFLLFPPLRRFDLAITKLYGFAPRWHSRLGLEPPRRLPARRLSIYRIDQRRTMARGARWLSEGRVFRTSEQTAGRRTRHPTVGSRPVVISPAHPRSGRLCHQRSRATRGFGRGG